ncbi:hypothetical protein KGV31_002176 [Vibrio parahaemolyticus]|nr:hypothetical protein [Vibrio parahaemolyticus]EHU0344319.1 hypothetical protein [Vibrio parahaemolyticus]EHU0354353.1 hypothetical protein [Vibrio parahaemolyticus]
MSIKRAEYDISLYRGDTPTYRFQIIDVDDDTSEETIVDITESNISGQVRYSPDSDIWFNLPITKTDPTNGIFEIPFTKQLSETILPVGSFEPDTAMYDIQLERDSSVLTFMYGKFRITRDITRA